MLPLLLRAKTTLYLGLFMLSSIFHPQVSLASVSASEMPPIYVSFVTHNEQPDNSFDSRYPDFTESEEDFWTQRDAVVAYADMLKSEGVAYNWQSAWNFLLAATMYDDGDAATGGKNIVAYLQSLGFSVNVHGHESAYNYADVAYLIDALGATPSGVMGGFLATPSSSSELEDLWTTQQGDVYDSYSWKPTVLWGAAGMGHQGDDELQASGVWKPKDNENFLTHSDSATLPVIGTYTSDWDGLTELLEAQAAGKLDATVMHTATIMVDQDELLSASDRSDVQERIEALQDEVEAGRVIWMSLEDVADTWESTYNNTPGIFQSTTQTYHSISTSHSNDGITVDDETNTEDADTTSNHSGSLIKTACESDATADDPCKAVYYVTSDGDRHAFPNEKVFFTWYDDFSSLVTVSVSEMASHPLGKNVTYHPGIRMVKFISADTVYTVSREGVLRPIASESVATDLYGSHWNTLIDDIPDAFYSNYRFERTVLSTEDYDPEYAEGSVGSIEENM